MQRETRVYGLKRKMMDGPINAPSAAAGAGSIPLSLFTKKDIPRYFTPRKDEEGAPATSIGSPSI